MSSHTYHAAPLQGIGGVDKLIKAKNFRSIGVENMTCCKVLIGVTGSVASIKLPELVKKLQEVAAPKLEIQIVSTKSALHFFDTSDLPVKCYTDQDEWVWEKIGDPVLHIELRKWADILLIAPLDANTLAKMANGICDNLLTCIVRAWAPSDPLVFCPAMNTFMWTNPVTDQHLTTLQNHGYIQVPPISKTLACGDTGVGAMASVDEIVAQLLKVLTNK